MVKLIKVYPNLSSKLMQVYFFDVTLTISLMYEKVGLYLNIHPIDSKKKPFCKTHHY